MPTDPTLQRTYDFQRQDQAALALARVLSLARLLVLAPHDGVPEALTASLDALREALRTYDFWTHP